MKDMMIGVDRAKTVFQVHGALRRGEVQVRKTHQCNVAQKTRERQFKGKELVHKITIDKSDRPERCQLNRTT